ncbi:MAG TPA: ABC-F family ATP-binding cassette domain-containing protein, partial [Candidatus Saccharibacteria bacterium]|nr:ABC-F family ATP-binding cassette domain-containing protein [Candidatus Saccharibacteria bacterium]
KSFGPKLLMSNVKFSVDDGEKVGIIGRNGVGKSTLFGILAGTDTDFTGDIIYRRGTTVVATAQEHHAMGDTTVLQYVLAGLPEYSTLSHIIETYPTTMGDNMKKIEEYTAALQRYEDKGFYQIEEQIERELANFQLPDVAHRPFSTLSGGQKRLVEVVKIMHSDAHLALVDEPTNHMDYVAKAQFIDWLKGAREAVLVITHDRDVLAEVDRIIELKDGGNASYKGNYDAYLKQNAVSTGSQMNEFELIEKRIVNLKQKAIDYQRLKEKSRNPGTIQKFKRLEENSRKELAELQAKEKPTFWIDKESVENLNYKIASQYDKFKARNVRINLKDDSSRSKHVLVSARDLALGYDERLLFEGIDIDLREGEAGELRGRNGAGKTTLIKALLKSSTSTTPFSKALASRQSEARQEQLAPSAPEKKEVREEPVMFSGELTLDSQVRVGIYEQEVSPTYFDLPLEEAIERMYLDRNLAITTTKVRSLMSDYLFTEGDGKIPIRRLSGGQKARFQLITMLANDPRLLILDEPTNHLDLPSIEELETALAKYNGAVLYVSHDSYFRSKLGGEVVELKSPEV